ITHGSFASHVTANARVVWPAPAGCTPAEAATLPITFLTAYYGLHHLAGIRPGDRVLIHAAAGGVGLAAVQLAQRAGAEVFATASPGKWEALRALGVRHVMNSRTLDFADEVLRLTDGCGVDVALNSLTGDFIPRTLDTLARDGRFLEIGKRNIWSPEEVAAVRPDVAYHVYDLARLLAEQPEALGGMLTGILQAVERGELRPLPRTEFPITAAPDAFRYMAQAKHVGKVVVTHPVDEEAAPSVRGDRSYLVTGGLGALGLAVAERLAERGAGGLVLVSRSAPGEEAAQRIAEMERRGTRVVTARADVAEPAQAAALFADLPRDLPALGGVVHLAGVLDDALLHEQAWPRFERVLRPKADGAWNLHALTRDTPLDFFVLFSSLASVLGSPGQANYAAANAFLDTFAGYRRARGLPALSVGWGPWAGDGMASVLSGRRGAQGIRLLAVEQALDTLEWLLGGDRAHALVAAADWAEFARQLPADALPAPLAGLGVEAAPRPADAEPELLAELRRTHPRRRHALLAAHVAKQVRAVLGLDASHALDPQQGLSSLGMDSLMAVELRSRLQSSTGQSLPATMAFEHPTIDAIAGYLASELMMQEDTPGGEEEPAPAPLVVVASTPPPPADGPEELDDLSEEEMARLLSSRLQTIERSAT
ncbi:MAG TPA: type I polyketide synthase, partial [Longimicrobium sp.]|nr:type I polyketide synthase [Longimicrobium sp.]